LVKRAPVHWIGARSAFGVFTRMPIRRRWLTRDLRRNGQELSRHVTKVTPRVWFRDPAKMTSSLL
jgi:hypothetical protein